MEWWSRTSRSLGWAAISVGLNRGCTAVADAGWQDYSRLGWLLLPPLRRQSDLRQPNQKHARSAPFPGVQAAPASRRRCVAYRSFSGAATRHASKDICAAATPGGEAGRGALAASQAQADGLPSLVYHLPPSDLQMI